MVELRGRLVVPAAPRFAAIHCDDRALIGGDHHDVRVVRVDPDAVVVVSAGGTADHRPCDTRVGRLPRDDAAAVHDVGVLRIHLHLGEVRPAIVHAHVIRRFAPRLPRVVRAVDAALLSSVHSHEQPRRPTGRDGDADAAESLGEGREAAHDRRPAVPTIGGLEQARPRPLPDTILPRALA